MLHFSITAISLSSYCNLRGQRIHNMNSRSFKSTQHFMFKGGISTFLLKLPGCADKAAVIHSGLTLLCGSRCHDKTSWGLRRAELSIPCCAFSAFRVHPGQAVPGQLCLLCLQLAVWTCSGPSRTKFSLFPNCWDAVQERSVEISPCGTPVDMLGSRTWS